MDQETEENIRAEISAIKEIPYLERCIEDKKRLNELEAEIRRRHPELQTRNKRTWWEWLWGLPLSFTYFVVQGHVEVARLKSGFRRMIFQDAVESHACYDFRMNTCSIYYNKEASDNNLYFSLLFSTKENAHTFQNKLIAHLSSPFRKMSIKLDKQIGVIESTNSATFVYIDDYNKSESSSPENSLRNLSVMSSELPNIIDPLRSLRSLENLSLIPRKAPIHRCHIAPKAYYKGSCDNDPNNILYGSALFHSYFDGDGKRRPIGADLDWGRPPELWIDYVEAKKNATIFDGVSYHEIFVRIMFREDDVADSMRGNWKDGTQDVGENGFLTSFFTTDAVKVKKYLAIKKRETRIRWGVKEDMITPQIPTIEEVEVAELDALDIMDVEAVSEISE